MSLRTTRGEIADFTADQFLLAIRMAYGIIVTDIEASDEQLSATISALLPLK